MSNPTFPVSKPVSVSSLERVQVSVWSRQSAVNEKAIFARLKLNSNGKGSRRTRHGKDGLDLETVIC